MSAEQLRTVVDAWADETARLSAAPGAAYVQLFENRGELMGRSNPHPHAQLWMTAHVPTLPARKRDMLRRYFHAHGRDLLGEYLERERRSGERVVVANEHWTALVPFWAVWPFQTMLIPSREVSSLPALDGRERDALADLVRTVAAGYDALFGCEFPYSMGWAGAPVGEEDDRAWRLHGELVPPLLRSATVRKFLVGYELFAESQRDLTPESAAERLREAVAAPR
jgi:UDPglucose--hexose-1-phosphate uridylyltransferase